MASASATFTFSTPREHAAMIRAQARQQRQLAAAERVQAAQERVREAVAASTARAEEQRQRVQEQRQTAQERAEQHRQRVQVRAQEHRQRAQEHRQRAQERAQHARESARASATGGYSVNINSNGNSWVVRNESRDANGNHHVSERAYSTGGPAVARATASAGQSAETTAPDPPVDAPVEHIDEGKENVGKSEETAAPDPPVDAPVEHVEAEDASIADSVVSAPSTTTLYRSPTIVSVPGTPTFDDDDWVMADAASSRPSSPSIVPSETLAGDEVDEVLAPEPVPASSNDAPAEDSAAAPQDVPHSSGSYSVSSNVNGREVRFQGSSGDGRASVSVNADSSGRVKYIVNGQEVDVDG
ncbi:hypothetical protein NA57DRAFT_60039 [Rhizodiscina lignyota]|uniref:Uncharacterized protein n=1 Tax=Rhizodiscina lignyota TaxID=1504668 RepID=A0A9P4M6Y8_9PEZI|nr:hypothetical protein NA57DRAFT_60039 [Rhizodiscina lignyota]